MSTTFVYDVGTFVKVSLNPTEVRIVYLSEPTEKIGVINSLRLSLTGEKEYLILVKWPKKRKSLNDYYPYDQESLWITEDRIKKLQVNQV